MTPGPGIEPGTHWWKASALTTAPTLLPDQNQKITPPFLNPHLKSLLPSNFTSKY